MACQPGTASDPLRGHKRYSTIKFLNQGSHGSVVLGLDKASGDLVAIKLLARGAELNKRMKYVQLEVNHHSRLRHPHVIQFKDVFLTPTHLCIAMEYAPGGDLFHFIEQSKGLTEEQSRYLFQQLITGLDYCHKMGIVNRDIKLENTLLDDNHKYSRPILKICDFGYAKGEEDSGPKSIVGTPGYCAPEVLLGGRYDGKAADVWSCGVMLYTMMFWRYPFERPEDSAEPANRADKRICRRILTADYVIPGENPISKRPVHPACKDLISKILLVDPRKRMTIAEIQNHPWYLQDLPGNVKEMTEAYLSLRGQVGMPLEEIEKIIGAAWTDTQNRDDEIIFGALRAEQLLL